MSASFITSFTEQEFRDFLRSTIKDIITEELKDLKPKSSKPLGITEAAKFLTLKIATLYEKTSRKLIPHSKKGGKLYFDQEDLEEWIKKGKVQTQQELESHAETFLLNNKKHKNNKR